MKLGWEDTRPNRRIHEMRVLVGAIMSEIAANDVECDQKAMHDLLCKVFFENGIHILSDADRAKLGLEPRDYLGWTPTEKLRFLEERQAAWAALSQTIPPVTGETNDR